VNSKTFTARLDPTQQGFDFRAAGSRKSSATCTASAPNGDTWTALQSPLGGNISKPISSETTYTLTWLALDGSTLTKSATVKITPTFQEN
jgi:hypothetical protein